MMILGKGRALLLAFPCLLSWVVAVHLVYQLMTCRLFHILSILILLLLFPVVSQSQSTNTSSVATEADLLSSLLALKTGNQESASALLRDHRELVTPRLC